MLVPKPFDTLRAYDRRQAAADVTSGVIVGIVALPLAVAFAIASGVTPDRGLCMSEWRAFRGELTAPRSDVLVMLATFTLTVPVDLVFALQAGMVLAAFLFMRRMSEVTDVRCGR